MLKPRPYVDLLACLLAFGLAFGAQQQIGLQDGRLVLALFAAAIGLAVYATRRQPDIALGENFQGHAIQSRFSLWGLLVLVLAAGVGGFGLWGADPDNPPLLMWILHLVAIALFFGAAYLLDRGRSNPTNQPESDAVGWPSHLRRPWSKMDGLLLLGIVILGLAMRFYQFTEWPRGLWFDEALYGLQALRILNEPSYWPIYSSTALTPAHYIYMIALSFHTWEISASAIRLTSALLGLATIPAGYLAGRELFGRRAGLIMALFMAVSRWNVNFSRIGMENITTPLFALLTIGFLLRGMRRGRYVDYALAGFALGFGLNFYEAFQLFVGVVGLFGLHQIAANWRYLRDHWQGVALMAVGVVLLVAPLLYFAYEKPDVYFSRTRDTSIFSEYEGAARWPALWENARKHILMYNVLGDPNGRHNLPGEPMLDPIVGALMVLGMGMALARFYRPRSLLLPMWMAVMLSASIFSLSFEAPQSLRGIGTLPAAYLLALVPISGLWRIWDETHAGRQYPRLLVWPLLALLSGVVYTNYQVYFERQIPNFPVWNAFSTPETIAAEILAKESGEADVEVISLFHNHPTLQFIARDVHDYPRLETSDHLPLRRAADRDVILVMDIERQPLFEQARRFYPNATFEEYKPPDGGVTVVYSVRLTPQDIASIQGLTATYFAGEEWAGEPVVSQKEPQLNLTWPQDLPLPVAQPFSAQWESVLDVPAYGPYRLALTAPAYASLSVDEGIVFEGSGDQSVDLVLAKGNHSLRVRAVGGEGPVTLSWKRPNLPQEPVAQAALYVAPVTANGLLGRYYANGNWQGPEAMAQIDPQLNLYFHIIPLPRPYTVAWEGKILAPVEGIYIFGMESIDESQVFIDGELVAESTQPNQLGEGRISLQPGLHDIRVLFADRTDHTHINLYWQPPGQVREPIPAVALLPPQGSYENIDAAMVALLEKTILLPTDSGAPLQARQVRNPVTVVREDLDQVRGIAAGANGRLYVTQPQRFLVLDEDGKVLAQQRAGSAPFVELSDVAVDAQGRVYVLDSGAPWLGLYSPDGDLIRSIPAPADVLGVARGIAVDGQGLIWTAITSGGMVASLDENGQVQSRFPVKPSGATGAQPVDVVVGSGGEIYVTDVANQRLLHLDHNGQVLGEWPIPVASSVDGPHLAITADGTLYMSEPEQGAVLGLYTATGDITQQQLPAPGVPAKAVGIAVSPTGDQIWVADSQYGRILRVEVGP